MLRARGLWQASAVGAVLLSSLISTDWAAAQDAGAPLEILDQHGGVVYTVAADSGLVYFGMGPRAAILRPEPPELLGTTVALPDLVRGLAARDGTLFVAAEDAGFYIFDVSDPARPVELAHIETGGEARAVTLDGERAYVSSWGGGVLILDISDPANPVELGRYLGERGANHTWASGDRAYVSLLTQGVRILDVTNPAQPSELASFTTAGTPDHSLRVGKFLYVADGAGIRVLDVGTDEDPRLLMELPFSGYARAMTLVDSVLFVAGGSDGVVALDVSVPDQPRQFPPATTGGEVLSVASDGLKVYASDWLTGVYAVHGQTTALQTLRISDMPGYAQAVGVTGDGLAVAYSGSGVRRYLRAGDGIAPQGFLAGAGRDQSIATLGSVAITTDSATATKILDLGSESPRVIFDDSFTGKGVAVHDQYAYISGGRNGLRILDMSSPTEPRPVARLPLPGFAWNAAVMPPYAYVAAGDAGMAMVDVASPDTPTFIGTTSDLGRAVGITSSDDYLYVAGAYGGLKVLQRSDPLSPTLAANLPTDREAVGVYVSSDRAYVSLAPSSLLVADVSNPAAPAEIAILPTLWRIYNIAEADGLLYLAGGASGVWVVRPSVGAGDWPLRSGALTGVPAATPDPLRPTPFALQPPLVTPDVQSVAGASPPGGGQAPDGPRPEQTPLKLAAVALAAVAALLAAAWVVRSRGATSDAT